MALQRARLEARLSDWSALTWRDEYASELASLHAEWLASGGEEKHVAVRDGWVPAFSTRLIQLLNPELRIAEPERAPEYLADVVVATIADFDRQLAAEGLELFVIPIPTRLHVYPELVCPSADAYGQGYAPGFTRFELALLDAGVEVVDLLDPFTRARTPGEATAPDAEQLFLRANTHWAPRGVVVAADALAHRLRATTWYEPPATTTTRVSELRSPDPGVRQPLIEESPSFVFDRIVEGGQAALGRDPDSPLVLLGDSFVTNYLEHGADFGRQLHHRLGFAPDTISIVGGGAVMVRRVFGRRDDPAAGKRAVVWMFAAGTLLKPEKQWRPIAIIDR